MSNSQPEDEKSEEVDGDSSHPSVSDAARRQARYDRAMLEAKMLAAEIYKGNDKLHNAHIKAVVDKFAKCVKLSQESEEKGHLRDQLDDDLRE